MANTIVSRDSAMTAVASVASAASDCIPMPAGILQYTIRSTMTGHGTTMPGLTRFMEIQAVDLQRNIRSWLNRQTPHNSATIITRSPPGSPGQTWSRRCQIQRCSIPGHAQPAVMALSTECTWPPPKPRLQLLRKCRRQQQNQARKPCDLQPRPARQSPLCGQSSPPASGFPICWTDPPQRVPLTIRPVTASTSGQTRSAHEFGNQTHLTADRSP